jgi:hypothetical protein
LQLTYIPKYICTTASLANERAQLNSNAEIPNRVNALTLWLSQPYKRLSRLFEGWQIGMVWGPIFGAVYKESEAADILAVVCRSKLICCEVGA